MTRHDHDLLRQALALNSGRLRHEELSPEQRQKLEIQNAQMAGTIMSIWIPFSWSRRVAMLLLALTGLYGAVIQDWGLLITWPLIALFSPRVVGTASFMIGSIRRDFADGLAGRPRRGD